MTKDEIKTKIEDSNGMPQIENLKVLLNKIINCQFVSQDYKEDIAFSISNIEQWGIDINSIAHELDKEVD